LTLDDDVAAKLRVEAQQPGQPFKQVVSRLLRTGLHSQAVLKVLPPFKVEARNMGLRPGLNLDDVWGLIEQIDDPGCR
jgi:hypothetical protein